MNNRLTFTEAGQLALQYHAASGNDDVIIGFLDGSAAYYNKAETRIIAGSIIDETRRKEILSHL